MLGRAVYHCAGDSRNKALGPTALGSYIWYCIIYCYIYINYNNIRVTKFAVRRDVLANINRISRQFEYIINCIFEHISRLSYSWGSREVVRIGSTMEGVPLSSQWLLFWNHPEWGKLGGGERSVYRCTTS